MSNKNIATWERYPAETAKLLPYYAASTILAVVYVLALVVFGLKPGDVTIELYVAGAVILALGSSYFAATRLRIGRRRVVARLHDFDRKELENGMPGYSIHQLNRIVPLVVKAPTSAFVGLRKSGRLKWGIAFCGKPPFSVDNYGAEINAPTGMLFCVYMDPRGNVFDWDWVEEDKSCSGLPSCWQRRFRARLLSPPRVDYEIQPVIPGAFHPGIWYSKAGNCSFVYFESEPAYAERVDDGWTLFKSLKTHKIIGIKSKRRLGFKMLGSLFLVAVGRRVHPYPALWLAAVSTLAGGRLETTTRSELASKKHMHRSSRQPPQSPQPEAA